MALKLKQYYTLKNEKLKYNSNIHEKDQLTGYECGFDAFSSARTTFDVHFYIIAIMFLVFDIEIIYFFPWALWINSLNYISFNIMFLFLIILTIGLIIEIITGFNPKPPIKMK